MTQPKQPYNIAIYVTLPTQLYDAANTYMYLTQQK